MNRIDLIQRSLQFNKGKRYLEIGVRTCSNLFRVKCENKVGVDPTYRLSKKDKIKMALGWEKSQLYRMHSDDFFSQNPKGILDNGFDVIFVDGLHNYKQSLQDVENGLKYLNKNGVIILHDCNPTSAARATPIKNSFDELVPKIKSGQIEGWDGGWNGDVWKTIVHLRSTRTDLSIITIDDDQGLGVIINRDEKNRNSVDIRELEQADYGFLAKDRRTLLNLKSENELQHFFEG
ncbi:class I SAM-dependent methyltransferase [Echinicola rosea]|uniref:Class I SAM-dependent methyltransferase n=1 Tax=Echinicola rosea TaxID=1807691 RepID=A0ABQ1V9P4_9BACT|nr:class I SAM-dependent methyltransferase [Echinicola rosea]GGF46990.1 hypothetical protein GCM10011339_39410 [Echinicola rosea]